MSVVRVVGRMVAGLIALGAIPAVIWLIIVLLQEVGYCWELVLAAFGLQLGAIKVLVWGAQAALGAPSSESAK